MIYSYVKPVRWQQVDKAERGRKYQSQEWCSKMRSFPGGGIRPPGFTRPPCTMEPWPSRLWNIAAVFYGFSILLVHKPKASGFQLRPFNGVRNCVRKLPRLPLLQKFAPRFGSFESLTSLFWFLFRR